MQRRRLLKLDVERARWCRLGGEYKISLRVRVGLVGKSFERKVDNKKKLMRNWQEEKVA